MKRVGTSKTQEVAGMSTSNIRGVNLGGWLVLERWISPSVFKGTTASDEHQLVAALGVERARRRLEKHRRTFITREHTLEVRRLGLNAVRVPVGYWLFEDVDGFVGGADRYLDQLFDWTADAELQVIICLHGAPGSQNGWDHSGKSGVVGWPDAANAYQRTLYVLRQIAQRYGHRPNLIAIEPLNEPHPSLPVSMLARFYKHVRREIKPYIHKGVELLVSDAFQPDRMRRRLRRSFWRLPVLDQHMYQLFIPEDRALDIDGHHAKIAAWQNELLRRRRRIRIVVGEWSAALDEYYDSKLRATTRSYAAAQYRQYAQEQQRAFEAAGCGWVYWTARTEDGGVWSLLNHPDFVLKA